MRMTSSAAVRMTPAPAMYADESAIQKYRRRKKPSIDRIQRGNFLLLRFRRVLRRVTLRAERQLVAVVLALMAFVNARADFRIVVPEHRSGTGRIFSQVVRLKIFREPDLLGGIYFDRLKPRVGQHRLRRSNILGF